MARLCRYRDAEACVEGVVGEDSRSFEIREVNCTENIDKAGEAYEEL